MDNIYTNQASIISPLHFENLFICNTNKTTYLVNKISYKVFAANIEVIPAGS